MEQALSIMCAAAQKEPKQVKFGRSLRLYGEPALRRLARVRSLPSLDGTISLIALQDSFDTPSTVSQPSQATLQSL